jgi:serralysin
MAYIEGTRRDELLEGTNVADEIYRHRGNDTLLGGDGEGFLNGGQGFDRLEGGPGLDRLRGGPGSDALIGGAGADYAEYRSATAGLTVSLANPLINTGDAAGDAYSGIMETWAHAHLWVGVSGGEHVRQVRIQG